MTPPLKWHGGKHYLATKIVSLFPPRDTYTHFVEPFFGGGAVLLAHDPAGKSEVVNDLNGELTNFWRVLREPILFKRFCRFVEATPFSEQLWREAKQSIQASQEDAWAAACFFIRCRQSRAGTFKDFATLSRRRTRRGMNEQAAAWLSAIEGLPAVHARLKRVVILNRGALTVIPQQDGPETVFYCDPPYLHETRATRDAYQQYEMDAAEHDALLVTLAAIKGRFLLSGYRSQLYDDAAAQHGWRRVDFDLPNNAAGGAKKRRMTECVWRNFG